MESTTSADGTVIAYERTGSGPPLVLVHGSAGDHTRWELFDVRPTLAEHFTVYAMDRRGRGGSGDSEEYALEREFEDVAAVVDSIDEPVVLLGHSFGALCALEAALLTDNLRGLVLYEPPILEGEFVEDLEARGVLAEMKRYLDDGEDEEALVVFLRDVAELTPEEIDGLRAAPNWPARIETAAASYREFIRPGDYEFDPARFADLTVPTVLFVGTESPNHMKDASDLVHEALPNSRIVDFEGEGHVAMNTAPERFIEEVIAFALEAQANAS